MIIIRRDDPFDERLVKFRKGYAIIGDIDELINIVHKEDTTIELFLVKLNAEMTLAGNFSGVKIL